MMNMVRKLKHSTPLVRTKLNWRKERQLRDTTSKTVWRRGFTLIQLVVSLGVLSMMATMLFNVFSDGRATARRTQCDVQLKTIALALDTYYQENKFYPASLQELKTKHYFSNEGALHCPMDIREDGTYGDFYAIRAPRDAGNLPTLVCPFHESLGNAGEQVFKDKYTRQFLTRPAKLEQASGATVERPGQNAVTAMAGMVLRGGDRVRTTEGGGAIIRFADTSSSELSGNADITVMQSFVDSSNDSPLYTLVRQSLGTVIHRVNHGSKFDVATPVATAGALGTVFKIDVFPNGNGTLSVMASKVYVSTVRSHVIIPAVSPVTTVSLTGGDSLRTTRSLDPNDSAPSATPTPVPTATPRPTATATPRPTATPCRPGQGDDSDNDGNNGRGNC